MSFELCSDASNRKWLNDQGLEWFTLAVRGPVRYAGYGRVRFICDPEFPGQPSNGIEFDDLGGYVGFSRRSDRPSNEVARCPNRKQRGDDGGAHTAAGAEVRSLGADTHEFALRNRPLSDHGLARCSVGLAQLIGRNRVYDRTAFDSVVTHAFGVYRKRAQQGISGDHQGSNCDESAGGRPQPTQLLRPTGPPPEVVGRAPKRGWQKPPFPRRSEGKQ